MKLRMLSLNICIQIFYPSSNHHATLLAIIDLISLPEFFKTFMEAQRTKWWNVLAYALMSKGHAERMVGAMKKEIGNIVNETGEPWDQEVADVLIGYRRRPINTASAFLKFFMASSFSFYREMLIQAKFLAMNIVSKSCWHCKGCGHHNPLNRKLKGHHQKKSKISKKKAIY